MSVEQFQNQHPRHHIYFVNIQHQNTPNVQHFISVPEGKLTKSLLGSLRQTPVVIEYMTKKSNYLEFKLTL